MTRLQFRFAREEQLRYLSHLDMVRLFHRALRRSGLSLAYSRGFNPHPQFNLAAPLPLAATAAGELGEIFFDEPVSPGRLIEALEPQLPAGLVLIEAVAVDQNAPALPALVDAARYRAALVGIAAVAGLQEACAAALEKLLAADEIIVRPAGKKKKKAFVNIRPGIITAGCEADGSNNTFIIMTLRAGSRGGVSPALFLQQVGRALDPDFTGRYYWDLHREFLLTEDSGTFKPLPEGM